MKRAKGRPLAAGSILRKNRKIRFWNKLQPFRTSVKTVLEKSVTETEN